MVINPNILDVLSGWSTGYNYTSCKREEDAVRVGGSSDMLAAIFQSAQVYAACNVAIRIASSLALSPWKSRGVKIFCMIAPFLSFPVFWGFAVLKDQQNYDLVREKGNILRPNTFPAIRLSRSVTKIMGFLANQSGNILFGAMIAGNIGFAWKGAGKYYGIAALAAFTYALIDKLRLIPRPISLLVEVRMPIITAGVGIIAPGSLFTRGVSIINLASMFPSIAKRIHHVVSEQYRKILNLNPAKREGDFGPTLREYDAPLIDRTKTMNYDTIINVLNLNSRNLEINPAHCSNDQMSRHLPVSQEFDNFLVLFDKFDWKQDYNCVRLKIVDDEKFPKLVKERLSLDEYKPADADAYIDRLAFKDKVTKEEFVAGWLRNRMVMLVDGLMGRSFVEGKKRDLEDGIQNCSRILPYLTTLDPVVNKVEIQDALLKLSAEAGSYCALGIKDASDEILDGVVGQTYKGKLLKTLQTHRMQIVQGLLKQFYPDSVDVHIQEELVRHCFLGFVPLSDYTRADTNYGDVMFSELTRPAALDEYKESLSEAIREIGEVRFLEYLRKVIGGHPLLTEEQADEIIEMYTERNDDKWTAEQTNKRFHNLLYVMLGVLRVKPMDKKKVGVRAVER